MSESDDTLLKRLTTGDMSALRHLLERHGPAIWAEMNRDIGAPWRSLIDADDVMQVTYMEAFLEARHLTAQNVPQFVGWLRRMARNNLRDAIKGLDRKKRPSPAMRVHAPQREDSYVTLVGDLGASSQTPSRQVARDEAARVINAMLERLPPDYRRVVRLYDLEGKPIAEVAGAVGRSHGAVHMLRARAHSRLQELLGSETDFFTHTA